MINNMKTRSYILESPRKTARSARLLAKAIDFFLSLLIALFLYPLGIVISIGYLCVSDYIQEGQSVGKRFIGFKVISLKDGTPCSLKQSIVRNLPFTVPLLFFVIPIWGWIIGGVLLVVLTAFELFLMFRLDSSHRLGDVMADTTVMGNDPTAEYNQKKKESWFEIESTESSPS